MELKDAPADDSNPRCALEVETLEVPMVEVAVVSPTMGNSDSLLPGLNSSEAGDEHPKEMPEETDAFPANPEDASDLDEPKIIDSTLAVSSFPAETF